MVHQNSGGREPIAIIGIGCQYPGIRGPHALWKLLIEAGEIVGPMPESRFKRFSTMYDRDAAPRTPGMIASRDGAYFDHIDLFDQGFFGISPRELERMDPQQRLLIETAWDTIEDAGVPLAEISGKRVGVYVGAWGSDWEQMLYRCPRQELDLYATTGSGRYALSGRLSYAFNLLGPTVTLDTACSTSLVAVHLACQGLRDGETEMALAGGVNLIMEPPISLAYSRSGMLSPLGRCKFGDAEAKGYVRSEACALVLLKTLSKAMADGDPIYALVAGSAVNSDGQTGMFVAPSKDGHEALMRQACESASINPEQVRYVEAHGTGTPVGDPTELEAMNRVMGQHGARKTPLLVGSVKTNLGHSESAAGVSGMIKAALSLYHRVLPPSRYPVKPSPSIPWGEMALTIPREAVNLGDGSEPIYAGVNSFGITGTNAHTILCSHVAPTPVEDQLMQASPAPFGGNRLVLPISARGEAGLKAVAANWADFMEHVPDADMADALYTATTRRSHLEDRLVVSGKNREDIVASLREFAEGKTPTGIWTGESLQDSGRPVFVFSGQGAHWWAMGRVLFESEPVYRNLLQRIDAMMKPLTEWSVIDELNKDAEHSQLGLMTIGQPALFALQICVAEVWRSWGVEPAAVVGHSMGEVTAAVAAGALSLEDGVRVIVNRARVMDQVLGQGTMAAAELSEEEAKKFLEAYGDQLSIAAVNGPKSLSISGTYDAVDALIGQLEADNVFCRKLKVDLPAHSRFMHKASEELTESCREIVARDSKVPIYSTVTGALAQGKDFDAEYWGTNLRQAVRFATAAEAIIGDGHVVFLEMNPHPILKVSLNQCLEAAGQEGLALGALRREEDDFDCMIESLAALHLHGVKIDWKKIYPAGRIVPLPLYPWQKERYWPAILEELESGIDAGDGEAYPWRHWTSPDQPDTDYWQLELTNKSSLVRDHRMRDRNRLPTSTLVDMALEATCSVFGDGNHALTNFSLARPIEIKDGQRLRVMLTLRPTMPGQLKFTVSTVSVAAEKQPATQWRNNAEGLIELNRPCMERPIEAEIAEWMNRPTERNTAILGRNQLYGKMQRQGCPLPERWQYVEEAYVREDTILARLSDSFKGKKTNNPFEAGCQLMIALAPEEECASRPPVMPIGIASYHRTAPGKTIEWLSVKILGQDKDSMVCNIEFHDGHGTTIGQMNGLHLATPKNDLVDVRDWFYQMQWDAVESLVEEPHKQTEGTWIILAKTHSTGEALAEALKSRGYDCLLIKPHLPLEFGVDDKPFNPDDAEDYARVITAAKTAASKPIAGLVNLLNGFMPKIGEPHENAMDEIIIHNCHGMLNLLQALTGDGSAGENPRLFLVTRGALKVVDEDDDLQLAQAPLWGMGKVIQHEHPELNCTLIDLDPSVAREDITGLMLELFTTNQEEQVAHRGEQRYAARLARTQFDPGNARAARNRPLMPEALYLKKSDSKLHLDWRKVERPTPGNGQVLIHVEAAGIHPLDCNEVCASRPCAECVPGIECAGRIVEIGPGVERFNVGDEIVALTPNACSTYVVADQTVVVKKPEGIDMCEAASLPVAYLNAVLAFSDTVKLRYGQRVLIHNADGPCGMAAVEIARSLGAEVFITARQPATRDMLSQRGAQHVFDDAQDVFVERIMNLTHDEGVDVILSFDPVDPTEQLLDLIPGKGVFIDATRTTHRHAQRSAKMPHNIEYQAIDLEHMVESDPAKSGEYLWSLMTRLFYFNPIHYRVIQRDDAEQAFRWIGEGSDSHKYVIEMGKPGGREIPNAYRPDAGYLITGGLGGLGLAVAQRMVERGAQRIALMGRSEPSEEARTKIEEMERQGAKIKIVRGDVTNREDLADIIHTIEWELGPLRGIMHCAGVLADGVLQQQTWGNFAKVLAPKVRGGWLLHELTEDLPLDFFVLFSSWASVLGSPGQANHSAANAFLDALAVYRRTRGLAAQSINWGPWGDIGVASGKGQGNKLAMRGIGEFNSTEGLHALELLMKHNVIQSTVMPFDLRQWLQSHPHAAQTRRFERIKASFAAMTGADTTAQASDGGGSIHDALIAEESREARLAIVQKAVCHQLAGILQMEAERVDINKPFKFLGLDSLTGLEFRNRLDKAFQLSLHVSVVWNYPTVKEISGYLMNKLDELLEISEKDETAEQDQTPGETEPTPEDMEELLDMLETLSDEDAQRMMSGESLQGE